MKNIFSSTQLSIFIVILIICFGWGGNAFAGTYNFNFKTAAGKIGGDIHGKIQPRYEYLDREAKENLSSFELRRAELDFRGYFVNKNIRWRLKTNLENSTLHHAWLEYDTSKLLKIRVGQQIVPWGRERTTSCAKHLFVERSLVNNIFEWPTGLDVGIQLHGKQNRLKYSAGLFDGRGKIAKKNEESPGNLYSTRLDYSLLDKTTRSEVIVKPVYKTNLSVGGGFYYTDKSHVRDWSLDNPASPKMAEQTQAYTANVSLQRQIYTLQLQGFSWQVDPESMDEYRGNGYTVGTGMLLVPGKLFAATRFSTADPDNDRQQLKEREFFLGLQWFHKGHHWKTSFELGREENHTGKKWQETNIFRIQQQLYF